MKKRIILQNSRGLYLTYYIASSGEWTDNIEQARVFIDERDMLESIDLKLFEREGLPFTQLTIYTTQ